MEPVRPEHDDRNVWRDGSVQRVHADAVRARPRAAVNDASGTSVRVLIVDDNALIRVALSGIIRQDSNLAVVGEACNAKSALEVIRSTEPHVVCLDVLMPGMDGLTALRQIRRDYPKVRVVIVTGQGTSDVVNEARSLGAHGFVVKPFSAGRVLNAIRNAVQAEGAVQH
jgi:DNA-binding NarL/FixJ family response regulator